MKKNLGLMGISFISFTAFLDFTIVNVALPTIQKSLALPITQLQWVISLYFLSCSILMVTMGKLGDIFGVRRILFLGALIFAVASLICGTAINGPWLFMGRFTQGIAAAIIYTLCMTMISLLFSDNKERVRAFSINGAANGFGIAFGPTIGGIILSFANWRWIFLINIPLILIGLIIAAFNIPKIKTESKQTKIDYLGMLLLAGSIGGLMLGLTNGAELGWSNLLTFIYFIIAIISFIFLLPWELKHNQPLLNFHYFTRPYFISSILVCIVGGLVVGIILFFDPLFLQVVRADSVLKTGIILLAIPIMTILVPPFVSGWINRYGKMWVVILCVICVIVGGIIHATYSANSPLWYIVIGFLFIGSSWAIVNIVSGLTAQAAVTPPEYGSATGTAFSFFNISASLGVALAVAIFHMIENGALQSQFVVQHLQLTSDQQHLIRLLLTEPEKLNTMLSALGGSLGPIIIADFKNAFVAGFHVVMWLLTSFCMLIIVLLFWAKKIIGKEEEKSQNTTVRLH